ncbi:RES family NAD+ phosphorylase [Pontibacter sp. KCTC 32443]|uniref:RES family NAD+ phosphorylase n=1 Tax=Pontibacter TaxID=323449 RepID=UPI00164CE00F|nr:MULTISPECIES: RES family NAD+ phosphorylase [Pontibacter]MBC5773570.1 RES family NAD+ phosphorylase [Pontibacter sp. KCTC 32443]
MIVYRLSRARFAKDLSGRGAELAGGRWNSKGTPILYTSDSIALCTVEVAVHMPLGIVPFDYQLVQIQLPSDIHITEVAETILPEDWKSFPHSNATQVIGDEFILEQQSLVLKVPSAAVQGTFNYLINPRHQDFSKVTIVGIEPFEFDKRLFVK